MLSSFDRIACLEMYSGDRHLAQLSDQCSRDQSAGTPNDGFLPNALKRCFRLSGVLLKLSRLILGCAIKCLSVRSF